MASKQGRPAWRCQRRSFPTEYIEVTQLRGDPKDKDFREYPKWKSLQARAGKVLLKVYQPEAEPIPTFDLLDFE